MAKKENVEYLTHGNSTPRTNQSDMSLFCPIGDDIVPYGQ